MTRLTSGCALVLLPLALLAAWRLRRRPVAVEDDDVEWSSWDPYLQRPAG